MAEAMLGAVYGRPPDRRTAASARAAGFYGQVPPRKQGTEAVLNPQQSQRQPAYPI